MDVMEVSQRPLAASAVPTELVQRGRMILDVAEADLAAAEARLGPFHETTWHFRNTRDEARKSWDKLLAEFGRRALEAALARPPATVLDLNLHNGQSQTSVQLVPIAGKTYRVEQLSGTTLSPVQFRLTRLPTHEDGPYYVCQLRDGSTQCDCAHWIYHIAETNASRSSLCKHQAALRSLGWL